MYIPSTELTYPTLGKEKSSSKVPLGGDMLVPRRINASFHEQGVTPCKENLSWPLPSS